MKLKIVGLSFLFLLAYTTMLSCGGLFGIDVQKVTISYGLVALKWGSIAFGFFMCVFLPIRIVTTLKKNEKEKYYAESDEKIRQAGLAKKALEDKIMQTYIKSEDSI